jgi:hypothetical protein
MSSNCAGYYSLEIVIVLLAERKMQDLKKAWPPEACVLWPVPAL